MLAAMEQCHIVASLVKCSRYMRSDSAGAANHQNPHLSKLTHRFLMRATPINPYKRTSLCVWSACPFGKRVREG